MNTPYENRQKLHQSEYFRGRFYENRRKLHQNGDFQGLFLKNLTLSDSNPDFRFYGVEIFTRIEAGFELSQLPNLILNICIFRKIVIDFNLECLFHMIGEE